MERGRPTNYTEDTPNKVKEYLATCGEHHIVKTRPKVKDGVLNGEEDYVESKVILPTIEGCALYLGITRETVYQWEKDPEKKLFSDIIAELRAKQAEMLINNGLSGRYNPVISKVLLTKHGYREGVEQTGADGKDLIPEPIDAEQKKQLLSLLNGKNDETSVT